MLLRGHLRESFFSPSACGYPRPRRVADPSALHRIQKGFALCVIFVLRN